MLYETLELAVLRGLRTRNFVNMQSFYNRTIMSIYLLFQHIYWFSLDRPSFTYFTIPHCLPTKNTNYLIPPPYPTYIPFHVTLRCASTYKHFMLVSSLSGSKVPWRETDHTSF